MSWRGNKHSVYKECIDKKMMKENKVEADFRIGKKKEHIVIDDDVIKVLAIMDEII